MTDQNLTTISWQAPEFRDYEKNLGWHISFIAISILIIGYQIAISDYFAALCIAIMAGFIFYLIRQRPKIVDIDITEKGIRFNDIQIPYKSIVHFWIINTATHKTLNIETTTYLNRIVILELEDQNPETVRSFLNNHLAEHTETMPSMSQRIAHRLKM